MEKTKYCCRKRSFSGRKDPFAALDRCNSQGESAGSRLQHINSSGFLSSLRRLWGGRVYRSDVPRFGGAMNSFRGVSDWRRDRLGRCNRRGVSAGQVPSTSILLAFLHPAIGHASDLLGVQRKPLQVPGVKFIEQNANTKNFSVVRATYATREASSGRRTESQPPQASGYLLQSVGTPVLLLRL